MFHKVVWEHMHGVVRFLVTSFLQIYPGIFQWKFYFSWNRLRFDRIMAMSLWPHFFGPPCISESRFFETFPSDVCSHLIKVSRRCSGCSSCPLCWSGRYNLRWGCLIRILTHYIGLSNPIKQGSPEQQRSLTQVTPHFHTRLPHYNARMLNFTAKVTFRNLAIVMSFATLERRD